ncbi:MAG TPA: hypothetical protein VGR91_16430 [Stellaceae bacterium]|nr:hypothetical protein [Stellaceae bacterium]
MPKFFVANATNQTQEFCYWLPEAPRYFRQTIPIGGQLQIAGERKELSQPAIDGILLQHNKYGLVSVEEARRTGKFSGLVYSIDRPVSFAHLSELVDRRRGILAEQGRQTRADAAIATNEYINDAMAQQQRPDRLRGLEMEILEQSRDMRTDDSPEVAEGVRVVRDPAEAKTAPAKRSRRKAG